MKQFLRPPMLSTSFSEEGKKTKKRFESLLDDAKKKKGTAAVIMILLLALSGGAVFVFDKGSGEPAYTSVGNAYDLDTAVSRALLNDTNTRLGECAAEGHIILDTEEMADSNAEYSGKAIVYALTMRGEYGFQDNNFTEVSGTGIIPAVITFKYNNKYSLEGIQYPQDGAGYTDSLKKMFPKELYERVLKYSDEDFLKLKDMEKVYAQNYLDSINRVAKIGKKGDFQQLLLTDAGVPVEISNKLCDKAFSKYPYWIGNQEFIENKTRYVYETNYDEDKKVIILSKYKYNSKYDLEECIKIDAISGAIIS